MKISRLPMLALLGLAVGTVALGVSLTLSPSLQAYVISPMEIPAPSLTEPDPNCPAPVGSSSCLEGANPGAPVLLPAEEAPLPPVAD